jgi:hypothetical protein
MLGHQKYSWYQYLRDLGNRPRGDDNERGRSDHSVEVRNGHRDTKASQTKCLLSLMSLDEVDMSPIIRNTSETE